MRSLRRRGRPQKDFQIFRGNEAGHLSISVKAEEVKKYILSTGDAQTQLASKTRTSRQLNLFKALAILDQGVSATGVIAVNTQNIKGFTADPNEKNSATDDGIDPAASAMSSFGKSLIDAMGSKAKRTKLGTQQGTEGF